MKFEWDEKKNKENIRKHEFDFSDACTIFSGPMLVWPDARYNYGEDRQCAIGIAYGRIVKLAYTERDNGETVRIISVRKADKYEREKYEKAILHRLGPF